jgi:hypothetical protein
MFVLFRACRKIRTARPPPPARRTGAFLRQSEIQSPSRKTHLAGASSVLPHGHARVAMSGSPLVTIEPQRGQCLATPTSATDWAKRCSHCRAATDLPAPVADKQVSSRDPCSRSLGRRARKIAERRLQLGILGGSDDLRLDRSRILFALRSQVFARPAVGLSERPRIRERAM